MRTMSKTSLLCLTLNLIIAVTAYMANLDVASTVFSYHRDCAAHYMARRNIDDSCWSARLKRGSTRTLWMTACRRR